jgi:hypothetical protein
MRVFKVSGDILDLKGRRIVGQTSQSEVYVDTVIKSQMGPYTVYELILFSDTLIGAFESNEIIAAAATTDDEIVPTITAQIYPIISNLELQAIGNHVSKDDIITITGDGYGATAKVTEIIPMMLTLSHIENRFLVNEVIIQQITGSETTIASVTTHARCTSTGSNIKFKNLVGSFTTSTTIYGLTSGATGYVTEVRGPIRSIQLTDPGVNYTEADTAV